MKYNKLFHTSKYAVGYALKRDTELMLMLHRVQVGSLICITIRWSSFMALKMCNVSNFLRVHDNAQIRQCFV